MEKLLIRIVVNAVALWVAAALIPGIYIAEAFWPVLLAAIVFGVVNALLRPILLFLSFPLVVLTLGLFTFVINALMLLLTAALLDALVVDGFLAALLGSLVISVVSILFAIVLPSPQQRR
jgi:putative membrane protein